MTLTKRLSRAKNRIKKAEKRWSNMSLWERAHSQSEGRKRTETGMGGSGEYYRVIVRPENEFVDFRYHDVGRKGHVQRLSGRRESGSWDTHAWIIAKSDAHREENRLVGDTEDVKKVLEELGSEPKWSKGDIFTAKDRPNVPEKNKPTIAQKRARNTNIKKAQAARRNS